MDADVEAGAVIGLAQSGEHLEKVIHGNGGAGTGPLGAFGAGKGGEDFGDVIGHRAVLEVGTLAPRYLEEAEFWSDVAVTVQGSEGHARVVLGRGWEAATRRSGGRSESGPADSSPGEPEHLRLLADWLDDSRRGHPSNIETSYQGFEILMGLALSSLERRRVDLPIRGTPAAILERLRDALPPGPDLS